MIDLINSFGFSVCFHRHARIELFSSSHINLQMFSQCSQAMNHKTFIRGTFQTTWVYDAFGRLGPRLTVYPMSAILEMPNTQTMTLQNLYNIISTHIHITEQCTSLQCSPVDLNAEFQSVVINCLSVCVRLLLI